MTDTYSTTAQVKSIVWVEGWHLDTQFDSFIDTLRSQAQDRINSKLRDYASVSFTGSEEDYNAIVLAETLMTAGYFRLSRDEPVEKGLKSKGEVLIEQAEKIVDEYIEQHYLKSKSDIAGDRKVIHYQMNKFWEVD